eukprot:362521-Chlamydomonas_euryale.AAC.3
MQHIAGEAHHHGMAGRRKRHLNLRHTIAPIARSTCQVLMQRAQRSNERFVSSSPSLGVRANRHGQSEPGAGKDVHAHFRQAISSTQALGSNGFIDQLPFPGRHGMSHTPHGVLSPAPSAIRTSRFLRA